MEPGDGGGVKTGGGENPGEGGGVKIGGGEKPGDGGGAGKGGDGRGGEGREGISHIPNARRQTPVELIIRHHNHRHRRIPKIIRQFEGEPVMVYENRVQRLVKQGRGNRPFELIEPDVQIDQLRQAENHVRELPGEPVVTHVQLVQPLQILEFLRDRPAEPVRVEVENREIRQQAELLRQESGNVAVVEVNAGDRPDLAVFRRPIAKHVGVVTHVRPDPIRSKVARI
nr:hypothetical protein TorRG33x02_340930 [Ipomoea batatas]